MNMKKILGIAATVLAMAGLYLGGKALGMDPIGEFAPYLATAIVGWVVYLAKKWSGLKLDFLNNEIVKGKVVEAIVYAEGKAVEKFKIDKIIQSGTEKLETAVAQAIASLPNLTEQKARELIGNYFPQIRPTLEQAWIKLAEEVKAKAELKKIA